MSELWPQSARFTGKLNPAKLVRELEAVMEPEPDELGNLQAAFRVDVDEDGFTVSFRDGIPEKTVRDVVQAHNPSPEPEPPPPPRPIEELNEAIQAASSLADVQRAFADFSDRYGDRL